MDLTRRSPWTLPQFQPLCHALLPGTRSMPTESTTPTFFKVATSCRRRISTASRLSQISDTVCRLNASFDDIDDERTVTLTPLAPPSLPARPQCESIEKKKFRKKKIKSRIRIIPNNLKKKKNKNIFFTIKQVKIELTLYNYFVSNIDVGIRPTPSFHNWREKKCYN